MSFTKLPHVPHCELSALCLVGAKITPYLNTGVDSNTGANTWTLYKDVSRANSFYSLLNGAIGGNQDIVTDSNSAGSPFELRFPNYTSSV